MIIGLALIIAYALGVLSRTLYEKWKTVRKHSPKTTQNREALLKTFKSGQLWDSWDRKVPKFTVKEREDGYWEVVTYAEDIDEFLFPDCTYLLKWKSIEALLAGNCVRMQYDEELTWKPGRKIRWEEDQNNPKVIITE